KKQNCTSPCLILILDTLKQNLLMRSERPEPGCPLREKLGPCVELCSSDSDCSVGEKCCSNGCGYECMSTTPLKPGICGHKVFTPWCYSFCNHDGDCPGEKKCCPTKCGHVCKNPIFLESV
uniref:WAP four-disulfide core domain 2 n=1 Tax=Fundulus heteroclitus TaxID=8078 RepID=A0A3Q2TEF4_FUNHE